MQTFQAGEYPAAIEQQGQALKLRELRSAEDFRRAKKKELTVIGIGAPWSAACRLQEPIMGEVAHLLGKTAFIAIVNIDQTPEVASSLGIGNIPTLIIFHKGREVQRFVGLQSEDMLLAAIDRIRRA